jgi:hypothetical protein
MLSQEARQLKVGDVFTSDGGATWHTVATLQIYEDKFSDADTVVMTTEECEKIWLWSNEDVVVRL